MREPRRSAARPPRAGGRPPRRAGEAARPRPAPPRGAGAARPASTGPSPALAGPARTGCRAIAIGASTGGPAAVFRILGALPPDFPVPILLVIHIAAPFDLPPAGGLHQG